MQWWKRPERPPRWLLALAGMVAVPIVAVAAANVFLALALPAMLNARPERTRIDYDLAWTIRPGVVEIRDLRIRSQSRTDQWVIEADRARARIDLGALRDRRFVVSALTGHG